MKTMRNEYRDLKKENDLIFSTLAEYDRDTITEIISVVDNTRGIGYEIELIRKDLIECDGGTGRGPARLSAVGHRGCRRF